MKDLLYLKDEQLKEFIEKLFIGYRESFGDAKKTLDKHSLGIAHHKVRLSAKLYGELSLRRDYQVFFLDLKKILCMQQKASL